MIATFDAERKILWENDTKGRILIHQFPVKKIASKLASGLRGTKIAP
jgi:hypothetical protein